MKNFMQLLVLLLWTNLFLVAGISKTLAQTTYEKGNQTTVTGLFTPAKPSKDLSQFVGKADYLELNKTVLQQLVAEPPTQWSLEIPTGENSIILELEPHTVLSPDFQVRTSGMLKTPPAKRAFYKGRVKDQKNTLVTISLFENMVMGFISIGNKDYVLGHLFQDVIPAGSEYILYEKNDLKVTDHFPCGTEDKPLEGVGPPTREQMQRAPQNVVDIYIEADYGLFQNKGTVQNTTDYVTGLFAQTVALYAIENINVQMSELYIWTTPDGYPSTSSGDALAAFRDSTGTTFNGDIALLAALDPGGLGGVAYLDVLCNKLYAKAYADINSSYASIPTYSWSVMVVTHELGHNLGSRHTHACSWGPNENEAIDGCGPAAGYSEGCSGNLPTNGGTMMSYCHLIGGVGINFNNGFGPNPGDKIRYEVSNAACLSTNVNKSNLDKNGSDNLAVNLTTLTVTHDVINNGIETSDSTKVGYFLTPNTTLSTYDIFLGYNQLDTLDPNESTGTLTFTVDIDTMASVEPGTYYVGYYLDYQFETVEGNENDNAYRFVGPSITKTSDNFICGDAFELINNGNYVTGDIDTGNGCHNCSGGAQHARWYKFTAPTNGFIDITSCFGGANTRLWVYTGTCAGLSQVGSSDDYCAATSGGQPLAAGIEAFSVSANTTYYFEWDNRWTNTGFDFDFAFYAGGEQCNVAVQIPNTGNYPKTVTADGPSSGAGCYNCTNATNADWFVWTAPSNGLIDVASCNGGVDTRVWIYSGSCTGLTQVGSSDDNCQMGAGQPGYASQVLDIPVTAGTTYYIEWDDRWSTNGFDFIFDFTSSAPPVPNCTVLSDPVFGQSNVDVDNDLTWVPASGSPTGYKLFAGYSANGNEILNGFDAGNVTTFDPGTFPYDTTIYVRIVPYNGTGDAIGCATENFSTQIAPPSCTNLSNPLNGATNVAITSSLSWNVAPGNPTGYRLTVGYTPGGGEILNDFNVGNVTTYQTANFNYNATVYVKIVPYNATGLAFGCGEESFTTQAPTPGCSALTQPIDGATNVPIDTDLSWIAANPAPLGYKLTVGYTSGGGEILNNFDVGNVTTYDPGNFLQDTQVYVKITPYNATGDAVGCPEEIFFTAQPLPSCSNLVSPPNGATNVSVDATIQWAAVAGATGYKITAGYTSAGTDLANNQDVGNVTIFDPGTLAYDTTIFVTIVPYNATGDAIGCPEESFSTQPPLPSCTTLSQPLNGATNVDPNIDFIWNATAYATGYLVSYGTNASANNLGNNIDVGNNTTFDPGTLPTNQTIYVRIKPYNASGIANNCVVESFQTLPPPPSCVSLQFPANGATDVTINPSLFWNSAASATGYKLTVGYTPMGGEVINNVDVGNTTIYQVGPLTYNTVVYVTVIAYNAAGDAQGCTTSAFTTQQSPPSCTNLTLPVNGATNVSINTDLTWNPGPPQTTGYKLTVGYTANGGEVINNLDVGNVTTYNPPTFLYDTLVFVKIVPYSPSGDATGCQNEAFRTEIQLPACTQLSNPLNGSTNVNINANLQWNAAANATGYKITAGYTPGGNTLANNLDLGNVTTWNPGTLPYNTTVYVTITPYNTAGDALGCQEEFFTTQPAVPACTSMTQPTNGEQDVAVTTSIAWNASAGATGYKLTLGYTPGGGEILSNNNVGNVTTYQPATFPYDTVVYVLIVPFNGTGDAIGCQEASFTTQPTIPACTQLTNPVNGSTQVNINTLLTWAPVSGATGYIIKAGFSPGSTELADNLDLGNALSFNPGTLPYNTAVYVSLRPYNSTGEAMGCQEESFQTQVALPLCSSLTTPLNGTNNVSVNTDLAWTAVSGATGYRLTVEFTQGGGEIINNGDVGNTTTFDPGTLPFDTTVFVKIVPYNASGDALGCQFESFSTQPPFPACTQLSTPADGATGVDVDADFAWMPVAYADGYKLSAGTTPGGTNILNNFDVGNVTTFDPGTLPYDSDIYVVIKPYNVTGENANCIGTSFHTLPQATTCTQLTAPLNGTTNIPVSTTISWASAPFAAGYKVTVGYSPLGGEILNNVDLGNVTTFNPGGLYFNATIYVKVTPYNAAGDAQNCVEESFTTQAPIPSCSNLVQPANGATNVNINTNFVWSTVTGATGYRISAGYTPGGTDLANDLDLGNTTNWNPGTLAYDASVYVRITPYNLTGDAQNCIEQSFTTQAPVPTCTNLTQPINGATNVDPGVDFVWNPVTYAEGYLVSFGTNPAADNLGNNIDAGNVTSFEPGTLPSNATIFVKITPYNTTGIPGNCPVESFQTLPPLPACSMLQFPQNGDTDVTINPVLAWSNSPLAAGYKLTVGYTPQGGEVINDLDIGNVTLYQVGPLTYNTLVYVTITPYNITGNAQGCTTASFTTQVAAPSCTNLTMPVNGATNVSINTDLTWNPGPAQTTGYKLTVGYTANGGELINNLDVGNVTTYNPPTFLFDTLVYVKIVPYSPGGDATGCQNEVFRTEIALPLCTQLTSPLNGSTNVNINSNLNWNPSANAAGYRITAGYTSGGTDLANNIDLGNNTSWNPGTLPYNTTIHVTITPYNAGGDAIGCQEESFTTQPALPGCTALTQPTNGQQNVAINTSLTWSPVPGATGYKITIGYTPGGGEIALNSDLGNVTTFNPGTLPYNTPVYVHITPYNVTGDAVGCLEEVFYTQPDFPGCTQLNNPADGATNIDVNADLSWPSAMFADGYKLSVGTMPGGTNILNNQDVGNVTTFDPGTLPFDSDIYVRIKPYNYTGENANCVETSFHTLPQATTCTQMTTPANGASNVSVTTSISWAAAPFATGYKATIGYTPSGGEILNNVDLGNVTTYNPGGLSYNATVYVKIIPYNAAGDAQNCTEGSFTTQAPIPTCTNLTQPLNGDIDVNINTTITWATVTGATGYRISAGYTSGGTDLANDLDLGNITSWNPGTLAYDANVYVRITPYNLTGDAQNCQEASFHTQPPVPVCTNLTQPLNGDINVDANIDFTWNPVAYANGYFISYGTNALATNLGNNINVGNVTTFDPGQLPANTTIYVKITPYNTTGTPGNCIIESFQTLPLLPACTALLSPLDGATNVSINPTLEWGSVAQADGYKLRVGYTPQGGEVLDNVDVGNVTLYAIGPLTYNSLVYVTVIPYNIAGDAPGCTMDSFTTQVAPPGCTNLTMPLNGDTDVPFNTTLVWNPGPPQTTGYKLTVGTTTNGGEYVNNLDLGNVTSYALPTLPYNTLVFVKIVPYSPGGDATGCQNETFTTEIAPPACTQVTQPINGSTGVNVNTNIIWNAVADATGYKVTAGFTSGGTDLANNLDLGNVTSWNPGTLPFNTTIFLTVTPYNSGGDATGCQEMSFTTQEPVPACTHLTNPVNGSTQVNVNANFTWAASPMAMGYKLTAGYTSGGTELADNLDLGNVFFFNPGTMFFDTTVYVTITPYNASGDAFGCQEESFHTQVPLPTCTFLVSPEGGATNVNVNEDLTWQSVGVADGYRLTVGYSTGSGELVNNVDVGNVTTFDPGTYAYDTTVFVKIVPYNISGTALGCQFQSFTTETPAAGCTQLSSPVNGATNVDINADLSWMPAPYADGYKLSVGTTAGGTDILNNHDVGNVTTFDPGTLPFDTDIFVTVKPYNVNGENANCPETSFHTIPNIPTCTNLVDPLNGATNVNVNTNIAWATVTQATGYKLTVGYTPNGGEVINNLDVGNVTSYSPGTLFFNTTVFVKIVPYNQGGDAQNCQEESFTTQLPLPGCATMIQPVSGSSNVDINTAIVWNTVSNATGYKLTVGYTAGGGEIINDLDMGADTSILAGPFQFDATVFVKIVPYNLTGNAAGCQEFSFSTEQTPQGCSHPVAGNNTIGNISATLRWPAVPDAIKYQIRYQVSGTDYWYASSTFSTERTLNWLFYNTTYEYQLATLCPDGWTDWSPVYTFTTLDIPECTLPLITGSSVTDTSFTINWSSIPSVDEQLINYRLKGTSTWEQISLGATDTSFTASGLLPGNEYQFRIRVNCSGTWTSWSSIYSVMTTAGNGPCESPTALAPEVFNTYANVSWNAVNDAEKYQIQYRLQGASNWSIRTVTGITFTTLTWLYYNSTYEYQLRTLCPDGWTAWSQTYTFTTLDDPACTLPPYASHSVTDSSFTVSWFSAPDIDQEYIMYRRIGESTWTLDTLTNDTSYTAYNLLAGNLYQFRFRVHCPNGWTGWSDFLNLTTEPNSLLCEAPDTLYTVISNTSATIAWEAVNGENRYQIRYRIQGNTDWITKNANYTTVSNLTWLYYGTTYEYEIRALCSDGWTVWSPTYTFTTTDVAACSLPPFASNSVTDSSFTVNWLTAPDIDQEIVMYRRVGESTWTLDTLTTDTTYSAYNLLAGNLYQFRFRVHCPSGWTGWSDILDLMTDPNSVLCEAPDTLYTSIGNTDATIAWEAVNGEDRYQFRYRIQGNTSWTTRTIRNGTVINLSWLYYGTTYEYEIRALCSDGWTVWSPTYTFTTSDIAACSLPPFASNSVTDSSFTVNWFTAPDIDQEIVMYRRVGESTWTLDTLTTDTTYSAYNLLAGNLYQFRFRVHCPSGWTGWSDILGLMTEPNSVLCQAPDTLYTVIGNTDATIAWNAVNGENRYQIRYRIQGTTDWITRSANNVTVINLAWLYYNTTYEYELRALCADGWTIWSQTYLFTTTDEAACSLPPFAGSSVSDTSFTVNWLTAPNIDEEIVMYRRRGDSQWILDTLTTDTVYTATNLLPGNLYQFRFRVHCPSGWTTWSDILDLMTDPSNILCEAPDTLYSNVDNISATIAWEAVNGENRYQIRYRIQGTSNWVSRNVTNGTVINLSWLFYGTTYEYELRALCVDGWTNWSQTYQFTTANDPACTLPPYAGDAVTETSFTVNWYSAPGIDEQIVMYRRVGDPDWILDTLVTDTFYTATNLLSGNTYQFRFRVHCPEGWSGWSDFKSMVTLVPTGNCDIPDTLYTVIGNTNATIAWTAENGANRYQIRYKLLSDVNWTQRTLTNNTVINLSWLFYDEDYEYQLRAECTSGWTDWSGVYYFTTLPDPACTTPWLVGHTTTTTSFTVTWDTVYQVEEYHFRYREKGTSSWENAYFASGNSYMAYNLPSATTYQYMMRSKCSNGWSAWTSLTEVTTDVSRPGPGKNTLGQQQNIEHITMELFPNPVSEFLNIQWQGEEGSTLFLSDINGRLVKRIPWTGDGRMEINVQSLQPGMYFITAIHSDGTKLTERFIKAFK